MKITFVMIVFQSDYVLEPCLRSVLPFGEVVAAEGPVQFWQERGYTTSTDRTNDILDEYRIPTVHGQWKEKTEEANAAIALVPNDTDFIWCLDADEIWNASTIKSIINILSNNYCSLSEASRGINNPIFDSVSFKATSFYGGFDRYMTGFEEDFEVRRVMRFYPGALFATHRPPTLKPDKKRHVTHHMNHEATDLLGLRMFHYSYVYPSQMKMKAEYYAAMGGTIPDYYKSVYLPWVQGDSEEKNRIETLYDGVHNWLPERRGLCWTRKFMGEHPTEIEAAMPVLLDIFNEELAAE